MEDLTADELVLQLSRAVDRIRSEGLTNLDYWAAWTPLRALLPIEECNGFMFMTAKESIITPDPLAFFHNVDWNDPDPSWQRQMMWSYKHGVTRRYLHVGADLWCYSYLNSSDDFEHTFYRPISPWTRDPATGVRTGDGVQKAIDIVFHDLEKYGATPTTKYDAEFIAERNARLVAAGYAVVG